MVFEQGQRVSLPKTVQGWVTIDGAQETPGGGWRLYVETDDRELHRVDLTADEASKAKFLRRDGGASSSRILAGMWTQWMAAAATNAKSTLLASSPLNPYAHQANAVYGAMLPQPWLRFMLADEPGTGKTIMAGLYLREMQRYGLVRKALIVAPANLVSKWQADFDRFFDGGLRRITADTVREHALDVTHDMWVVSLELAAVNGAVQEAIRPDRAGWDVVVFDEAHRLTPTAQTYHRVGRLLSRAPRTLLMTATPHRGSEWLFRHLLHIVDPDIYPDPGADQSQELPKLTPGPIHFLRRMKEDLVDYDGQSHLFKRRRATNHRVPLSRQEHSIYTQALDLVDRYMLPNSQPLARMVYGKRAASSVFALRETLRRRHEHMGRLAAAEASVQADPYGEDEAGREEAQVVNADSAAVRAERKAISDLVEQVDQVLQDPMIAPSKWRVLIDGCLAPEGIRPGNGEQAVIFTEFADTAEWIVERLTDEGYTARMYSGRQTNPERDEVRAAFMRGDFQIIVSTDAGNEGIDLQVAHVLINFDIPWSLVRLEQRMGRIHRVGQTRDVELFNLIAVDTREGATLHRLLDLFVTAANELDGQMFDSLSLVAELSGIRYEEWLQALYGDDVERRHAAEEAVRRINIADLRRRARQARAQEAELASKVEAMAALTLLQEDLLERINPAIVEAFLKRLDSAELLRVQNTAAGDGILLLTSDAALPAGLGGEQRALVATSSQALKENSGNADISRASALGPGSIAFGDLIEHVSDALAPDLYRGGAAEDPTSITGYELYAYEATLTEVGGRRRTAWAGLIRVDETGDSYPVRWETLANLVPTIKRGGIAHPAREQLAEERAHELASGTRTKYQEVRDDWFASARRDLENLPVDLTHQIPNRDERLVLRKRLRDQAQRRLTELERLSKVEITEPTCMARMRVYAGAVDKSVEEKDSERIAMRHVQRLLQEDGWVVADIHAENRGYDLQARRGREQRLVEVKGVWDSAGSRGIRLTGNEVLMAMQHRRDYWLYVVDQCHDRRGTLFGSFRDPIDVFAGDIRGDAVFRIPGSSLRTARDLTQESSA
ncbi:helicase-related protein [Streptomyces sp. NPDC056352]|uniref:helicase-related protein n=1 Tax=Streptomyces sp. NPDC056352 TaxID=3345791 RepID=UPI0035E2AC40